MVTLTGALLITIFTEAVVGLYFISPLNLTSTSDASETGRPLTPVTKDTNSAPPIRFPLASYTPSTKEANNSASLYLP